MVDNIQLMELLADEQKIIIVCPEKHLRILADLRSARGDNSGNFFLGVQILGAERTGTHK
jgi:hypothetical protein